VKVDRDSWRTQRARNDLRCERLVGRSALLDTTGIEWHRVPETAIDDDTVACLVYMRDVEAFTNRDLVGLAGHPRTLSDPLVARFLDRWRAEEAAHAEALGRFLDSYRLGHVDAAIPAPQAVPPAVVDRSERRIVRLTRPVGQVVTAAHMTWGAINELLTLTGYRLLSRRCGHPQLSVLLDRIADQEARHFSFYVLQAEWRLRASRIARVVLPRMLQRTWTPVGVGAEYKQPEEFDRVLGFLSASTEGQAAIGRMDATLDRLPGLTGLHLYERAATESLTRLATA
jgi:hypothetical protein